MKSHQVASADKGRIWGNSDTGTVAQHCLTHAHRHASARAVPVCVRVYNEPPDGRQHQKTRGAGDGLLSQKAQKYESRCQCAEAAAQTLGMLGAQISRACTCVRRRRCGTWRHCGRSDSRSSENYTAGVRLARL